MEAAIATTALGHKALVEIAACATRRKSAVCHQVAFGTALDRLYAEWGLAGNPSRIARAEWTARMLSMNLLAIATIAMAIVAAQALHFLPTPCQNFRKHLRGVRGLAYSRQYGPCAARTRASTRSARRGSPVIARSTRSSPRIAANVASTPSTMAFRS